MTPLACARKTGQSCDGSVHAANPGRPRSKAPRIDLVKGADLEGLPPTTIIFADIDPPHDDGGMLGEKLEAAGVNLPVREYAGVTHELLGTAAVANAEEAQRPRPNSK